MLATLACQPTFSNPQNVMGCLPITITFPAKTIGPTFEQRKWNYGRISNCTNIPKRLERFSSKCYEQIYSLNATSLNDLFIYRYHIGMLDVKGSTFFRIANKIIID